MYCLDLQGRRVRQTRNQREKAGATVPLIVLVSCLAYSSTLKREAVHSSKISANFYQTTRCYISSVTTVRNLKCNFLELVHRRSILREDVSETGSVSVLRFESGGGTYSVGLISNNQSRSLGRCGLWDQTAGRGVLGRNARPCDARSICIKQPLADVPVWAWRCGEFHRKTH
jgi:hypothetical protein